MSDAVLSALLALIAECDTLKAEVERLRGEASTLATAAQTWEENWKASKVENDRLRAATSAEREEDRAAIRALWAMAYKTWPSEVYERWKEDGSHAAAIARAQGTSHE